MDVLQDWTYLLESYLLESYYPSYIQTLLSYTRTLRSSIQPLIDRLISSPDIASIALLLLSLYLSLKILNMLRRAVMAWIYFAIRIVFWSAALAAGFYVYNRGFDAAVEDAAAVYGHWAGQYEFYKGQAEQARLLQQGMQGRGGYGRTGGGREGGRGRWR